MICDSRMWFDLWFVHHWLLTKNVVGHFLTHSVYSNYNYYYISIYLVQALSTFDNSVNADGGCLPFQKSEVGDSDTEDVRMHSLSWHIGR